MSDDRLDPRSKPYIRNPQVEAATADLRLTGSSQMTVSTVASTDTRASELIPAARPNLGKSQEALAAMNESELANAYGATTVGSMNTAWAPLDPEQADQLNNIAYKEQRDAADSFRKREEQMERRQKYSKRAIFIMFGVVLIVVAIIGFVVSTSEEGSEESGGIIPTPETNPGLPETSPPDPTQDPNTPPESTLTENPTQFPETNSPTTAAPTTAAPTTAAPTTTNVRQNNLDNSGIQERLESVCDNIKRETGGGFTSCLPNERIFVCDDNGEITTRNNPCPSEGINDCLCYVGDFLTGDDILCDLPDICVTRSVTLVTGDSAVEQIFTNEKLNEVLDSCFINRDNDEGFCTKEGEIAFICEASTSNVDLLVENCPPEDD